MRMHPSVRADVSRLHPNREEASDSEVLVLTLPTLSWRLRADEEKTIVSSANGRVSTARVAALLLPFHTTLEPT